MFTKYFAVKVLLSFCIILINSSLLAAPQPSAANTDDLMFKLRRDTQYYSDALARNDSVDIAEASYLLAKRHINLGNYAIAQTWLLKALHIRTKFGHFEDIGKIYLRLQEIQLSLEHPSEAIMNAKMAMINFKKAASRKGMMSAHMALGTSHYIASRIRLTKSQSRRASSLHSAITYFTHALLEAKTLGSDLDQGQAYRYLGLCAEFENRATESIRLRKQAWAFDIRHGLFDNAIELATDLAESYLRLGDMAKTKLWLDRAEHLANGQRLKSGLKRSLMEASARYHELNGNWKTALQYRTEIGAFKDSLFIHYRNQAVESVQKTEQAKLRETILNAQHKQMALLKKNALLSQRILLATSLLLIVFILAAFLYGKLYWKYKKISHFKTLLIKEQSHRTKNDLQAVSNLLSLQIFQVKDQYAVKLLEESLMRVESIVMIHQRLYQDTNPMFVQVDKYLKDLTDSILTVYNRTDVTVGADIDSFFLAVEKMVPFALIVNELTTNACKYAFGGKQPSFKIQCHLHSNSIRFFCEDNGPGFDQTNVISGFGMELIDMMTQQLDGESEFARQAGCLFSLSFPLDKSLVQYPVADPEEYVNHA